MPGDDEAEVWEAVVSFLDLLDELFASGVPLVPKAVVDFAFLAEVVVPAFTTCSASEREYHKFIDFVDGHVTCERKLDFSQWVKAAQSFLTMIVTIEGILKFIRSVSLSCLYSGTVVFWKVFAVACSASQWTPD